MIKTLNSHPQDKYQQLALSSRSSHWMITEMGGYVKVQRVVSGE